MGALSHAPLPFMGEGLGERAIKWQSTRLNQAGHERIANHSPSFCTDVQSVLLADGFGQFVLGVFVLLLHFLIGLSVHRCGRGFFKSA